MMPMHGLEVRPRKQRSFLRGDGTQDMTNADFCGGRVGTERGGYTSSPVLGSGQFTLIGLPSLPVSSVRASLGT